MVRVEDCEDSLYAAVDLVADKLKRKLVKVGAGLAGAGECWAGGCWCWWVLGWLVLVGAGLAGAGQYRRRCAGQHELSPQGS